MIGRVAERQQNSEGPMDLRSCKRHLKNLSVRRRPGYSSSGCTPAEPDSASPGGTSLTRAQPALRWRSTVAEQLQAIRDKWRFSRFGTCGTFGVQRRCRRVEDWSGRPDVVPGVRASAAVEEMGRPGTRLQQIASGRIQTQVLGPGRLTRIEGSRRPSLAVAGVPQTKPPVENATTRRDARML